MSISNVNFMFIHIGKCGGSSVSRVIENSRYANVCKTIHISSPPVNKYSNYLIIVRNPLNRFVSAFNWRYRLVVETEKQKTRFSFEHQILSHYKTANRLAMDLYTDSAKPNSLAHRGAKFIHHIYEDISFYLKDLLDFIDPSQIMGVLVQERLNDDIERFFGVKNTFHEKINPPGEKLSQEAALNVKALSIGGLRMPHQTIHVGGA